MKKLGSVLIFVTLFNVLLAQEVGEIFNNNELYELFGKVKQSVNFETKKLKALIPFSGKYIMFRIIKKDIVILDENRKQLYPFDKDADYDNKTVFKYFSVNILTRLLNSADYNIVRFEEREKALVVKYKNKSMERGASCPPVCPELIYAISNY